MGLPSPSAPRRRLDRYRFFARMIEMIIKNNQSLGTIVSDEYLSVLQVVAGGETDLNEIMPHSSTTIRRWIIRLYLGLKRTILSKLQRAKSCINISFDLWTSSNDLPLCGIVGHSINENGKYTSLLLGLPMLYGQHSGINIAAVVTNLIRTYNIADSLGYFMLDNAPANSVAIEELAKTFRFNAKHRRLRCAGHIINLVAKAMLIGTSIQAFTNVSGQEIEDAATELQNAHDERALIEQWRKKGPVGKLHNVVRHVRGSPQRRRQLFESLQRQEAEYETILRVVIDGGVRWNAMYYMIDRAVKLHQSIRAYISNASTDDPDLAEDYLTADDWAELTEMKELLKPLKAATMVLEGNAVEGAKGALWEVLPQFEYCLNKLEGKKAQLQHQNRASVRHFRACVNLAWTVLDRYYRITDDSPAYRAAVILHPSLKWSFFNKHWADHPEWLENARQAVQNLWSEYRSAFPTPHRAPIQSDTQAEQEREFQEFMKLDDDVMDEYHHYCSQPRDYCTNPIQWWIAREEQYPRLSRMALDLFSVPAMSSGKSAALHR